jgi:glyoxylase-like metal-dependent hydrolase (beta-lactamase superfamily II)
MNPRALPLLLLVMAVTAVTAVTAATARAQDLSKVEIKTVKVADGVYMLQGAGGNIGVSVGEDGVLLIDDQFAPLTPKVLAAVKGITPKAVRFVLNTHVHGDHVGGNENLAGAGAVIVAHENVRKRMIVEQFVERLGKKIPPAPKGALPVVTFTRDVTFHWNGDLIEVTHVGPAHTDGDSIVRLRKANVVHMGDCLVTEAYPFVDTSTGGSFDGFIRVAKDLLDRTDAQTKIIPGHGTVANREGLERWLHMLTTIRDRVTAGIAQKKTLAQIQATRPTREWDARLGKGFITPKAIVEVIYRSETAKSR